ncbi:M14 family zinc carboxypeptidase [Chryseobacterium sp. W4I1]|uniref:M14 family zinc carboxypeptidase n=1 Tax=Chryseobacterium sp. W4I1 TaxID=3042293 RepID=UPI002787AC86|nr:M14 family zinc carboxypeptidase [Chryseobacterium sp. W4I1]MDQ0781931.1 tetratricopeptide (TPR) repeat protein [Chryseobacterium sp. W4I1]
MNFEEIYFPNPNFLNRYISPEKLFSYLQTNFSGYIQEIGRSYLDKPIYQLSIGTGSINVLAWSQMHGNESNATHAILDLLETLDKAPEMKDDLFGKITLDFIFMLNPDGSERWTRLNAADIDLNRDFHNEASKEIKYLKKAVASKKYDYALNLHEQRTIFTTDGIHPATLSFLAPSENIERTVTDNRKKCMAVIGKIYDHLKDLIPNQIGRYSDEFYPTSTGDNFIKAGMPTILFEGGHFIDDYTRKGTRKYYTIALYYALKAISELDSAVEGWEKYLEIPENQETHYDIIYRNVKLNTDHECILDVAVQYREIIEEGKDEISFVPYVMEVGDVKRKKGWLEIDCTGKKFVAATKYPKLDAIAEFTIED